MRLLDTSTQKLTEFQSHIPDYAILSHVWGTEEVTFRDIADLDKAKKMHGFAKILSACNTAINDGFKYIWIDTCCINKESSAELSEAINSMYAWYRNARICYAYLSDVPSEDYYEDPRSLFSMSRWFSRGWTLQELIAPLRVIFYGRDWVEIGTKATLQRTISVITGIRMEIITGGVVLDDVPVAVRMSWAANRETTREEDIAYSLMGLFDVNMPLLYGEGRKAFIRLQHEIIKKSNDHSIFAWFDSESDHRGILAHSPSEFHRSGGFERVPSFSLGNNNPNDRASNTLLPPPYSITNQGLHIELPIVEIFEHGEQVALAFFDWQDHRPSGGIWPLVVTLIRSHSSQPSQYVRIHPNRLSWSKSDWEMHRKNARRTSLYVADDYSPKSSKMTYTWRWLHVKIKVPAEYGSMKYYETESEWEKLDSIELDKPLVLEFEDLLHKHERFACLFGLHEAKGMSIVWCDILTDLKGESETEIAESYRSPSNNRWTRKQQFLDKASAYLDDGWSVTVSSGVSNMIPVDSGGSMSAQVELKKSLRRGAWDVSPLIKPQWTGGCFVIPPAPNHGFTVDVDNLRPSTFGKIWTQRLGSFLLHRGDDMNTVGVLTFKSSTSGEEFYLLVYFRGYRDLTVWIEKKKPMNLNQVGIPNENRLGIANGVVLAQGKLVFVTVRECREIDNYIINVSM